ncbi:MAG TPA: phosphatase PAP2 family protein [Patescibacteria group bacterium]|nr:phosphatase PAP2 family protein [Patescibacteria group bacterium]
MEFVRHHKKWVVFFIGLLLFLLFVGFSYIVHKNIFIHLDFNTTVRLQDHISRRFDGLFSFFSDVGKFEIVTTFLLIISAIYFWKSKNWIAVFVAFFSYISLHAIEVYGKAFVHHLPPPHFLLRTHDVFTFPEFYVQATNSYPSGHAGRALFITVFVGIIVGRNKKISRTLKIFIYSYIALYDMIMLTSRIYLGEHWLSDVIGGSLLGIAMGIFASVFLYTTKRHNL